MVLLSTVKYFYWYILLIAVLVLYILCGFLFHLEEMRPVEILLVWILCGNLTISWDVRKYLYFVFTLGT